MPTYRFRNKKTGKEWEEFMTIAEAEQKVKDDPNIEWMCGAPLIGDPWRQGMRKPDSFWRDKLKEIKKRNPGSTINDW